MKLISKIDISNFRSIHKATLASPDRFKNAVFLAVENGVSKSDLTFAEPFLREVIDASQRMAAGVAAPVQSQLAAAGNP